MLKALLGIFAALADWFRDRQLIEAGKAEQAVEAVKEVERRVEQAQEAGAVIDGVVGGDPARADRLRSKYDRSRRSQ
jgi:hypothetical protein